MANMDEHAETAAHPALDRMRAVTISREYGSGGGEIASRLARHLSWQLVDHQVVANVAQDLGVSLDEAEAHDERTESFIERVLTNLQSAEPSLLMDERGSIPLGSEEYARALERVVRGAAASGHVVIVGRGGQAILAGARDILHIRIVAPLAARITYVAHREGLDAEAARRRVQEKDRARVRYLAALHHCDANDATYYDMTLNTATLSLDQCVDLTIAALTAKAARLDVSASDLGPGAGISRYPSQPVDLPAPPTNGQTGQA